MSSVKFYQVLNLATKKYEKFDLNGKLLEAKSSDGPYKSASVKEISLEELNTIQEMAASETPDEKPTEQPTEKPAKTSAKKATSKKAVEKKSVTKEDSMDLDATSKVQTSAEWEKESDFEILVKSGWAGTPEGFFETEKITLKAFNMRVRKSTVRNVVKM